MPDKSSNRAALSSNQRDEEHVTLATWNIYDARDDQGQDKKGKTFHQAACQIFSTCLCFKF
jgi:hypothetical protein